MNTEAARLALRYVNILRDGNEPPFLEAWIDAEKYEIYKALGNRRYNMSNAIQYIRYEAASKIRTVLNREPDLAILLAEYRNERNKRAADETFAEQNRGSFPPLVTKEVK